MGSGSFGWPFIKTSKDLVSVIFSNSSAKYNKNSNDFLGSRDIVNEALPVIHAVCITIVGGRSSVLFVEICLGEPTLCTR